MLLKRRQSSADNLVQKEFTTFGISFMQERKRRGALGHSGRDVRLGGMYPLQRSVGQERFNSLGNVFPNAMT